MGASPVGGTESARFFAGRPVRIRYPPLAGLFIGEMMGMKRIPKLYKHGKAVCDCIENDEVIVMERSDEGLWLRFAGQDDVWALGWAAFFSGRFIQFDDADMEDVSWLG